MTDLPSALETARTRHPFVRPLAFYLPQFHPIPENDTFWGEGFTEWTNVRKAGPLFPGHYQPHVPGELGYYDLRDPEARARQAQLAGEHGVYGFVYYHYWFHGRRVLERPFDEVLASGQPDFPFCICWANEDWTRSWDGRSDEILIAQRYSESDDLAHIRWLARPFQDERYIRVDGKPLLLVYRARHLADARRTTSTWREEAGRLGMGELYLCRVENFPDERSDPAELGFDAGVQFQPDWLKPGPSLIRSGATAGGVRTVDYANAVALALTSPQPAWKRYPAVTPGFDTTPRRQKAPMIFENATPELYAHFLQGVLNHFIPYSQEENLVFINAWNEWGEGNHLEPDMRWGRRFLEAQKLVLDYARLRGESLPQRDA